MTKYNRTNMAVKWTVVTVMTKCDVQLEYT